MWEFIKRFQILPTSKMWGSSVDPPGYGSSVDSQIKADAEAELILRGRIAFDEMSDPWPCHRHPACLEKNASRNAWVGNRWKTAWKYPQLYLPFYEQWCDQRLTYAEFMRAAKWLCILAMLFYAILLLGLW